MLLSRVNKERMMKIVAAVFLMALLITSVASAATLTLWCGNVNKGEITSRNNSSGGSDVAVEEVVKELGLIRNSNQRGVVVSMSGYTIEFWSEASVIRSAHNIVPIPAPITVEDGHWWVDSKSVAQAFDQFLTAISMGPGVKFTTGGTASKVESKPKPVPVETKPAGVTKPTEPAKQTTIKPVSSVPVPKPVTVAAAPAGGFKGEKKPIVVLDAGHGGHDPGASGNGLREKDIALKATLQLGKILASYGIDVRYTRTTDVYLKLAERTAIANKHNAYVFISMHCNAVPKGRKASGLEYYIMAPPSDKDAMQLAVTENREISSGEDTGAATERSDKKTQLLLKILGDMQQNDKINESTSLCEVLHANAKSSGLPMRAVRQAPFFVLRGAAMPAVLVEMGFITDAAEAKKLNTENYRDQLCRSIAAGVVKYIKDHPVNAE